MSTEGKLSKTGIYITYQSQQVIAEFKRFDVKMSVWGYGSGYRCECAEIFLFKPIEKIPQGEKMSDRMLKVKLGDVPEKIRLIAPGQKVKILGYFWKPKDSEKLPKFDCGFKDSIQLIEPILPLEPNYVKSILGQYEAYKINYAHDKNVQQIIDILIKNWRKLI